MISNSENMNKALGDKHLKAIEEKLTCTQVTGELNTDTTECFTKIKLESGGKLQEIDEMCYVFLIKDKGIFTIATDTFFETIGADLSALGASESSQYPHYLAESKYTREEFDARINKIIELSPYSTGSSCAVRDYEFNKSFADSDNSIHITEGGYLYQQLHKPYTSFEEGLKLVKESIKKSTEETTSDIEIKEEYIVESTIKNVEDKSKLVDKVIDDKPKVLNQEKFDSLKQDFHYITDSTLNIVEIISPQFNDLFDTKKGPEKFYLVQQEDKGEIYALGNKALIELLQPKFNEFLFREDLETKLVKIEPKQDIDLINKYAKDIQENIAINLISQDMKSKIEEQVTKQDVCELNLEVLNKEHVFYLLEYYGPKGLEVNSIGKEAIDFIFSNLKKGARPYSNADFAVYDPGIFYNEEKMKDALGNYTYLVQSEAVKLSGNYKGNEIISYFIHLVEPYADKNFFDCNPDMRIGVIGNLEYQKSIGLNVVDEIQW